MAQVINFPSADERNQTEVAEEFAKRFMGLGVSKDIAQVTANQMASDLRGFYQALIGKPLTVPVELTSEQAAAIARAVVHVAQASWIEARFTAELRKSLGRW